MEGTLSRARVACRLALLVPLSLQLSGCAVLRQLLVPVPLAAGQRVRVSLPSSSPPSRTGRLLALTEDSLILGRDSTTVARDPGAVSGRLALSLDSVDAFEVSRGVHRDVVSGVLAGGILGSLGGLVLLCARIQDCLGHRETDLPGNQAAAIMMISAGAGVLIGGTLGFFVRGEQWDPVPLNQLGRDRVAPSPQSALRLKVGFSLFPPFAAPRRAASALDR